MNIAVIYVDITINQAVLAMIKSIFKLLGTKDRKYTLITNVENLDARANFDVFLLICLYSDEKYNGRLNTLKSNADKVVCIALGEMKHLPSHDIFIDIAPGFLTYIKNGTLIYSINKVLADIQNGNPASVYKPVLRKEVIRQYITGVNAKTYLEIGVSNGENFLQIEAPFIIGVDPVVPNQAIKNSLSENRLYFQMKSDDFFIQNKGLLESRKVDLAFIDGAHNYKQSLRDLKNCLQYLNHGGCIIMHDCNPISEWIETPAETYEEACSLVMSKNINPYGFAWTGDVWKTIVYARSIIPDLKIMTLDCDFGLGVISKYKSECELNYNEDQINDMHYSALEKDRKKLLNLVEPEELFLR
jgi:hypothetical protein